MKIEGDDVIFSNGKVKYANCGIIGISPDGNVTEGYDGGFTIMTDEERVELADYMINTWQEFKDNKRGLYEK